MMKYFFTDTVDREHTNIRSIVIFFSKLKTTKGSFPVKIVPRNFVLATENEVVKFKTEIK